MEGRGESNETNNNAYGDDNNNRNKLPKVNLPSVMANSAAQRQMPSYNGVLAKNLK